MRAVGTAHGRFRKQCRVFNGEPHPRGRRPGLFTSEAEFSKGYRRFASVITLAKCGSAVKAWYHCENWARRTGTAVETAHSAARPGSDAHGPGGTAVKTAPVARVPRPPGRRGSHWGRLAALEQVNPHWSRLLTCPNDPFPTPMRTRIRPRPLADRHPGPCTHAPQPPPQAHRTRTACLQGPARDVGAIQARPLPGGRPSHRRRSGHYARAHAPHPRPGRPRQQPALPMTGSTPTPAPPRTPANPLMITIA